MAKLTGHYFWRGRKIMTRYFRRNASGLLLYFAYSIARFIGDLLIILIPAFATSSFNSGHMLKETGDLYLSKSFDNAEDKAAYRALAIFSAIVLLSGAAFIGVLVGLELYINFLLNLIILNPDSAMIFKIMVITVFSIIELIAFLYVFGLLQAGSYISRKNTKLGVGDIAFNAMNYMKNHGGKIMSLDFGIIFFYAIWVVIYPVGWFLFPELSSTGANIFPVLFTIL
ncbi:MAG: hypothetical protein J6328_06065, partial [Bacilli bacterium]|nr:hypothetical protein [Bacilli bacterium]